MTDILSLSAERAKRERPDADCVRDHDGTELNLFAIDYPMSGKTFSFEVWATSFDEAEAHVEAIRSCAVLAGMIKARGNL